MSSTHSLTKMFSVLDKSALCRDVQYQYGMFILYLRLRAIDPENVRFMHIIAMALQV